MGQVKRGEIIKRVDSLDGETINEQLWEHAVRADDWPYQEHLSVLHEWRERFNREISPGTANASDPP
jgi:hypothetical protein